MSKVLDALAALAAIGTFLVAFFDSYEDHYARCIAFFVKCTNFQRSSIPAYPHSRIDKTNGKTNVDSIYIYEHMFLLPAI